MSRRPSPGRNRPDNLIAHFAYQPAYSRSTPTRHPRSFSTTVQHSSSRSIKINSAPHVHNGSPKITSRASSCCGHRQPIPGVHKTRRSPYFKKTHPNKLPRVNPAERLIQNPEIVSLPEAIGAKMGGVIYPRVQLKLPQDRQWNIANLEGSGI